MPKFKLRENSKFKLRTESTPRIKHEKRIRDKGFTRFVLKEINKYFS